MDAVSAEEVVSMREKIRRMTEAFEVYHAALHRGGSPEALEVKRLDYEIAFLEAVASIAGPSAPAKVLEMPKPERADDSTDYYRGPRRVPPCAS
jgi:hypothetical protein